MISANAPISEETVFVVDDDEAVRDSMRWLLEGNGYRVVTFASAEAFLEMVEPHAGGCLIADIRMPGMDGLELQARLLERGCRMPVIVVTGHQSGAVAEALAGLPVALVSNPAFAEGLSTSVRAGIAALPPQVEGLNLDRTDALWTVLTQLRAAARL
jgi:FixJ family two-component response regulator